MVKRPEREAARTATSSAMNHIWPAGAAAGRRGVGTGAALEDAAGAECVCGDAAGGGTPPSAAAAPGVGSSAEASSAIASELGGSRQGRPGTPATVYQATRVGVRTPYSDTARAKDFNSAVEPRQRDSVRVAARDTYMGKGVQLHPCTGVSSSFRQRARAAREPHPSRK